MKHTAADTGSDTISVVLADDHDIVRSGVKALLATMPGVEVIGEAGNGEELLAYLNSRPHPDVVITDLAMPGLDGLAAIGAIRERYPDLRVLVLSMYDTVDFVKRAVACGANGYVSKDAPPEELEWALKTIKERGSYFGSIVAQRLLQPQEPSADEQLTDRQIEILTLLARGLSSKEIGYELGLSSKTVDVHRARIMYRLGLSDLASLTRYAVRKGLVEA
jgi:DNA-binding NarL/FixJ family response regulator